MRIAFLGADDSTADLVRAVVESQQLVLVGICEFAGAQDAADELGRLAGQFRPIGQWEALLDDERVDAVVVARGNDQDRRAEQLRKFIQTGMPVLASHPVVDSMLVYYELDMIRRETGSVIVPHLAGRNHPAVRVLAQIARGGAASPIGKVEHVTVERCVAEPTRRNVERQFARDVDLVRGIAGEITRLGAMGGAAGEDAYSSLGAQMAGPAGIAARWSVVPIQSADGAKITLTGSRGRAALDVRGDGEPWTLELSVDGQTERQEFDAWDPAAASLAELTATIGGGTPQPDWVDAARSVELAETIDRSLQKARTIDLYYEDYTEEGTFKGTMTSVGCGLLLLGIFVLVLVGIAEQVHIPYVRYWPYVMLGLFGVFLFVQLAMLTKGKRPREAADAVGGEQELDELGVGR
ncbi:MAG: Gfo/Idh/MocA family oxidoreductase [Pirellulales bacterium]